MRVQPFAVRFCPYRVSLCFLPAIALTLLAAPQPECVAEGIIAPFQFTDVSAARGINVTIASGGFGAGAAAADFDDDGDIDVFIPAGDGDPDRLYKNLGNGDYREIASGAGLASLANNRCALWLDYDGDGDLDLLVGNDEVGGATTLRLYRQYAVAQFEDVTFEAGLFLPIADRFDPFSPRSRGGISAGDINNDGYIDFFAPLWNGDDWLFVNNGNSTFSRINNWSDPSERSYWAHGSMMADFDGDGWLDIYVAQEYVGNRLWINQHNNTFVDMAPASSCDNAMNDMGLAMGDIDQDGDPDFYATNIFGEGWNVLLRNESVGGSLQFAEMAQALGVDNGGWGWGATFFDADKDGRLDLAATNGWGGAGALEDESKMFWNKGNGVPFQDVSASSQFNDVLWGSALIAFDYDRDGDLDMLQACKGAPSRLLENQPSVGATVNNYLVIRPRMAGTNHFAIGSVVRLSAGGQTSTRWIMAGTSYLGQEPAEAFFGVGSALQAGKVRIDWPDGTRTVLYDVPVNQVLTVAGPGVDPTVPTVSEWGLIAMVCLLLTAGGWMVTRRRLATPVNG